ncbi:hypothetical protein [Arthrobacter sp. Y81]|uniref:hypothetical protein n=1 Tax=Arthrobacter sp. Y81 TaxID=2058897 RepID=UPI00280071AB|nr:hypothetical protein [Arthrobacter sp. Y81]
MTSTGYEIKYYRHPLVGEHAFDCHTWNSSDGSGQRHHGAHGRARKPIRRRAAHLLSWQDQQASAARTFHRPS